MKPYIVTGDITFSFVVSVVAVSYEDAIEKACEMGAALPYDKDEPLVDPQTVEVDE